MVTIASCTGHSFVYTREIPEGESEDIEYLTPRSYARFGSICHGTHIGIAQSILRQGIDMSTTVSAQGLQEAKYDTLLHSNSSVATESARDFTITWTFKWPSSTSG